MDSKRYMISDVAKMVDVESHVLRYWEDELELPIMRNEMGHRCYTEDNIQMFHHIKDLKEQGFQLKAIKALLTEMEQGNIPPAIVREPEPPVGDKMEQFQVILGKVVSQAIRESQQEMGKELSHQVSSQVVKEMDYLFRLQEEREETHYKKLDELIRSSQKQRRVLALGRKAEKKKKEPRIKKIKVKESKIKEIKEVKEPAKKPWFFGEKPKKDIVL
ncbi:MAG TPA: transcriptional regulator [Lachnospiraceae bacterium]|nr:transcriptional regulator [Lachnospiraceae bacterium]